MKLPDGPRTPPLLQQIQWIGCSVDFLDSCSQRYGDPFTVKILGAKAPAVFFSNPQAIQAIYTAPAKQFESGSVNGVFRPVMGEHSLLLLDGERHQRQRQVLSPPFHGERMRAYGQIIIDVTQQVTSDWAVCKPFSVRDSMQEITLQVILRAVFGLNEGERYIRLKQLLKTLLASITSPLYSTMFFFPALQQDLGTWSPWGDFLRKRQKIDDLIYAEISQRQDESIENRTDILSLLLSAVDSNGQPLTDRELRDELITLLVAGHETTASALAWVFYWVHYLPEVLERLLKELNSLDDVLDPSVIVNLPYLTAVCQETLRIYPVALISLPRVLSLPIELMDYHFEVGTILIPCIYLAHRSQKQYPEPQKFNPDRFLQRKFSPYEYLPFGGGNRSCIGFAFAFFEMKLVLATVLSSFNLALSKQNSVRPIRRGITTSPSGGVKMVVIN